MKRKWCIITSIISVTAVVVAVIDYMHKKQLRDGISCYSQVQYDYVSDKKRLLFMQGYFSCFQMGMV